MGIKNLKVAEGELKSILGYSIITWLLIVLLKNVPLPVIGSVLSLDFNLILGTMIMDWVIVAGIVLISAIAVEYFEDWTGFDTDKIDRFESIIIAILCVGFYPLLFILGTSGSLLTISFAWQEDISGLALSALATIGVFNILGYLALKIASEIW